LVKNPNHIGCRTLGSSESFFAGTQDIEKELIQLCAKDILRGGDDEYDGYVAAGGTEANMQAIWIYRNFFINEMSVGRDKIAILCSDDSHYSMDKGSNVFSIDILKVPVDFKTRTFSEESVKVVLEQAKQTGKTHFIVIANMMTTMFGSVDDVSNYTNALESLDLDYKLHVDGAYGGFYYPFTKKESQLSFANSKVSSITLDAHKMAQAPYGTGMFLIRKNYMHYANTEQASYVEGENYTLSGSRSGANAVAVWMILMRNGPFGWQEKIFILQKRTDYMCEMLKDLGVDYYRHPKANIITMDARFVSKEIAQEFGLVPDSHAKPSWYKIVMMEHVTIEKLMPLTERLRSALAKT